ncbi:porin [Paraburkholderia sediminicola]|uniref:porin n=1 Tax=Paraburkholderia sediminicola TaxID=458836 RepID=UPI0038B9DA01
MNCITAISFISAATIVGGWCSTAQAQSVTLYGIVDTGVEYIHNANPAGHSLVRIPPLTGESPSRWGLKGVEPLGNGYKAIFAFENGFTVGTGNSGQGGRLFGRQALVGIDGPLGVLTFGRQYSMLLWASLYADFIGPNIYGSASLDTWLAAPRTDNSVAYRKSMNGLTVGGSYSFGRDASPTGGSNTPGEGSCAGSIAGNFTACREWSALLQYDANNWGVATAYDRQNGGPGSAVNLFNGIAPLAMTSSSNSDSRLVVDGYLKFEKFMFGAMWINRRVEVNSMSTPSVTSNQFVIEGQYKLTPFLVFDGLVQRIGDSQQDTRATMQLLRATYLLSVRTSVYAQIAFLQNSRNGAYSIVSAGGAVPAKGTNQSAGMIGIRHFF